MIDADDDGGSMNHDDLLALPLLTGAVVMVLIDTIFGEMSLRSEGISAQHVAVLSNVITSFPPIVIHQATMRVIDGAHRVQAALRRGEKKIPAVFFAGSDDDAYLLSVKLNRDHGLPLTRKDRQRAIQRIATCHPDWSNHRIAALAGVSPKTVGAHRQRPTGEDAQSNARVGRDGRVRPVDVADVVEGRRQASQMLHARPDASVREVAGLVGIAPSTVSDVRRRISKGLDPVPDGLQRTSALRATEDFPEVLRVAAEPAPPEPPSVAAQSARDSIDIVSDPHVLGRLSADPSVRSTVPGRMLLRVLHSQNFFLQNMDQVIRAVPMHRRSGVAAIARRCADSWLQLASALDGAQGTP
jgi:transposase